MALCLLGLSLVGQARPAEAIDAQSLIALADQDDVWLREKLAKLHLALESHPGAAYAFCNARLIDAEGREIGGKPLLDRRFASDDISRRFDQRRELDLLLKRDFVYGTTLLFRADLRDLVLPIGASWSHDSWIVNMLALCGYGGVPVLETLVLYRQHASQASGGTADPRATDFATRVCAYEELREALVRRTGDGRHSMRPDAVARIDDKLRYLRALRDSREQSFLVRARTIASDDDCQLIAKTQAVAGGDCGGSCGFKAVRRHIGGAHAGRIVDDEDDPLRGVLLPAEDRVGESKDQQHQQRELREEVLERFPDRAWRLFVVDLVPEQGGRGGRASQAHLEDVKDDDRRREQSPCEGGGDGEPPADRAAGPAPPGTAD